MANSAVGLNETDRAPFLAGRMRRETAVILGAMCADDGLSGLEFPDGTSRSPHWRAALERGDFIPTIEMVNQLDGALAFAGHRLSYAETVLKVESSPLGPTARHLRKKYGLTPVVEAMIDQTVEIGAGLGPFSESIRGRDRMLVTGPLVNGIALLTIQTLLVVWSQGVSADFLWPAIVGFPSLLGLSLILCLPAAEQTLTILCGWWRSSDSSNRLESVRQSRDAAGLTISHEGSWHQPSESVHLLSKVRVDTQRAGLLADIMERVALILGLNAAFATGLAAVAMVCGQAAVATLAWICMIFVLGILALVAHRKGLKAQSHLESLISQGLGLLPLPPDVAQGPEPQKD